MCGGMDRLQAIVQFLRGFLLAGWLAVLQGALLPAGAAEGEGNPSVAVPVGGGVERVVQKADTPSRTEVAEPGMGACLSLATIRSMSPEVLAGRPAVSARGVVTWVSDISHFVIQDESAGVWVHLFEAREQGVWKGRADFVASVQEGMVVEVSGLACEGGYSPLILPNAIVVVGRSELPAPALLDRARFFAGLETGRRGAMRAVVRSYQPWSEGWRLQLDANPGLFTAVVSKVVVEDPRPLVDAEVWIAGVAGSVFNTRGELIMPQLRTRIPGDVRVEKPAPRLEEVPEVPLRGLMRLSNELYAPHRVRLHGTVICTQPDYVYLQEGDRSVRVEGAGGDTLQPGDRVVALGFVDMTRNVARLVGATCIKVGKGSVPESEAMAVRSILALNMDAAGRGIPAQPHDYDGHLIRTRARLLAVQALPEEGPNRRRLTVEQDGYIFNALLERGATTRIDALRPGSLLDITGIVVLGMPPEEVSSWMYRATRLDLLLRAPEDVVVREAPSWWTPLRLLGLSGALLLTLGLALVWVWQLRRQVRRKTAELASEMRARRDAAIEFQATMRERNRLAANLHDTLLQTMSGLSYQLEACEAEAIPIASRPANHLELARRMVVRAQEDLRGTVWALRALPLNGRSFTEALGLLVARLGEGHRETISVTGEGDFSRLSDFVAGNLLLVAQEGVSNALRHARATRIDLRVELVEGGEALEFRIRDDGVGFDPESRRAPSEGHFGIEGMRERLERLGGSLDIASAPGAGTLLCARVPVHAYDGEIS